MADRNIKDVIQQIREQVPDDEETLLARLLYLDRKVAYCPPECAIELWHELAHILTNEIGEPKLDWQIAVRDIVANKRSS